MILLRTRYRGRLFRQPCTEEEPELRLRRNPTQLKSENLIAVGGANYLSRGAKQVQIFIRLQHFEEVRGVNVSAYVITDQHNPIFVFHPCDLFQTVERILRSFR